MNQFEVGKVYFQKYKIILEEHVMHYRCVKRTPKTVWLTCINDDGTDGWTDRYRIYESGEDGSEYAHKRGLGNPRSVRYSDGPTIYAREAIE